MEWSCSSQASRRSLLQLDKGHQRWGSQRRGTTEGDTGGWDNIAPGRVGGEIGGGGGARMGYGVKSGREGQN